MPFRAVRLPHSICNNLIFGSILIRHHPENRRRE